MESVLASEGDTGELAEGEGELESLTVLVEEREGDREFTTLLVTVAVSAPRSEALLQGVGAPTVEDAQAVGESENEAEAEGASAVPLRSGVAEPETERLCESVAVGLEL